MHAGLPYPEIVCGTACRLEKKNPEVLSYLEQENQHASGFRSSTVQLQSELKPKFASRVSQHEAEATELSPGPAWYQRRQVVKMPSSAEQTEAQHTGRLSKGLVWIVGTLETC